MTLTEQMDMVKKMLHIASEDAHSEQEEKGKNH